ncbi:MAG: caspase family protein, partial [Phreatobacter sp.]
EKLDLDLNIQNLDQRRGRVGSYRSNPLPNALNNAGLMAQTLRDLGFSTTEGADLPQAELRAAIAGFMVKARQAGPDAIVLIYLAGLGLQHEGDSYLLPSDAAIDRESDVPIMGIRLVDVTRALGSVQGRARLLLLDLSAEHPWAALGLPVRRGVGVIDAGPGLLVASAAAPSEIVAPFPGAYGRFALALAEQLRAPGVPLDEAIARARLRVHQQSNGRDTPWEASRLPPPVRSLTLPADPTPTGTTLPALAARRIEGLPVEEAYALAIERDSIAGYQEFLRAHPASVFTRRVQRLLAARREALVWRQTLRISSPPGYWTYLRRYPRGPHAEEARWRLGRLQAPVMPSQGFVEVVYEDIPAPLPVIEIVDDPVFWAPAPPAFYDDVALAPVALGPPIAPIWALPPPPAYSWGVLPVAAAAAVVGVPFILPRGLRRPELPVVLRPPPGGPRLLSRPGTPGPVSPVLGGLGSAGRPLPGAPGGGQLPRPQSGGPAGAGAPAGAGGPAGGRPAIHRPGRPFVEDRGRPSGRPGMRRPGRVFGPAMQQSRRPEFQARPRIQRADIRPAGPSRPAFNRAGPARPVFRPSGPSRPFMGRRR